MKNSNPTSTKAWRNLKEHYISIKETHLTTLFKDKSRAEDFTIQWNDFLVDYSKNRINHTTRDLLLDLASEIDLKCAIDSYFEGEAINATENRAVMHTALRDDKENAFAKTEVQETKAAIKAFTSKIISGEHKGVTGKAITDVVNIGIGGSDLGPVMVVEALKYYKNHLKTHFISNVDGDHLMESLKGLNLETTMFLIVSKSFTTQDTISNATTIRKWFVQELGEDAISKHFAAVSANLDAVTSFGISSQNVFPVWDWVGGRFSLWSAVGLSIALAVGYDHFEQLLSGANEMDIHFKETPFENNIPVISALLGVWYNNFFGAGSEAVIPYSQYLHRLPAYLQQSIMESNGKGIDRNGDAVDYQTGTIIWGGTGTNSQHAFFQLFHQGTKLIPSDFIGFKKSLHDNTEHHDKLMANFFAQTEALMRGKTREAAERELENSNLSDTEREMLIPFKVFEGNKPTTTFLIDKLTPKSLGALVAMYEHKIFVQGIIWNIYSYDQWGVELGKQLAEKVLSDFEDVENMEHDSSTSQLMRAYKNQ